MARRAGKPRMLMVSVFAIASVALLACFAASASATKVHVYSHSFGAGELSLTSQSGIAVNRETGDLYVADTKHSRIAKFTGSAGPAANFATVTTPTSIAVDNSSGPSKGDIYVVEGGTTVSKLDPTGALVTSWGTGGHLTGLNEILGIAVNPAGNLWVLSQVLTPLVEDRLTARTYNQAGVLVTSPSTWAKSFPFAFRSAPVGIAIDSADALYSIVGFYTPTSEPGVTLGPEVRKFGPAGETLIERLNTFNSAGIATDPTNDDVYFGRVEGSLPPNLFGYSSAGAQLETFGGEYEGPVNRPISEAELHRLQTIASIAIGEGSSVDVADWKGGQISAYDLEEVVPPTVTIEPPDTIGRTSAHIVGHINLGVPTGSPPSHDVSWEFSCTPSCPGHGGYIEVKTNGGEQTVEATLTNLEPGSKYSVFLTGKNRGGASKTPVEEFETEPAPPTAKTGPATEVARGEATLNGTVNSNGLATTYHFEYTTKAAFEAKGFTGAVSTPDSEPLPAPAAPHVVSARVGELQAAVEYVYRVVATNALETTDGNPVDFRAQVGTNPVETGCPNQALRTEAGARLPDCRAYEMVTPAEKLGSLVEPYAYGLQAASDGSGVTWFTGQSATGVPSPEGGHQGYAFYLSTLTGESWSSQRLLAPQRLGGLSALVGLTGDERYAVIETADHAVPNVGTEARQFEPALYLLDTANQTYTAAIVPPQVGQEVGPRAFALDGASANDSLIFFESRLGLTTNAVTGKNNLYMWNRESKALSLAGVLPGAKGEAPAGGAFGGSYSWWGGESSLNTGGAEEAHYVEAAHAISESGDSVYFTAGGTGQVYLRHGLTSSKPTTVRVSIANAGVSDPNGQKPAAFQEATPDGSKAFFLSSGKLTLNANTGAADEGSDLYRYDTSANPPLVDVSPLPGGAGARVQGLLGVSADGRSGYFVAKGILAPKAVEGDSNVYHFQEEANGTFAYTFVADLGSASGTPAERNWSPTADSPKTARVSMNGATLLFMSQRALTSLPEAACIVQGACMQVYRYSVGEGAVACLSCNPTGEGAPRFGAELTLESEASLVPENHIRKPGNAISGILTANLSTSGDRVFFQSSEGLLPEDKNGTEPQKNCGSPLTCVDVYEWEAVGTGSCKTPNQAGGCLYLLSTGESRGSSYFLNASADGSSAFILTSSSLVPADQDELPDIYDARIEGGLAAQHATPPEPCGSSEACKGPGAASPPAASAGTSSFQGPGNPIPPKPCKKGSVRKHGKCVKSTKKGHKKKSHSGNKKKHRSTGKKRSGGAK